MDKKTKLTTPVLLIAYRRPHTLKKVISALRRVKPQSIYVFCDGPKINDPETKNQVEMVHDVCMTEIDWDCSINTNFQTYNMGCRNGVKFAIDWFFSNVKSGIILEDDIVPIDSFFAFCQEMLEFYKDDKRVAQICGLSRCHDTYPKESSYSFSRYPHIWGWATWSRAWDLYDDEMSSWSEIKKKNLLSDIGNKKFNSYWTEQFDLVEGGHDTWDLVWAFSVITQNMISVVPKNNLITNIGFGEYATHTEGFKIGTPDTKPLNFPLKHPKNFFVDDSVPSNIAYQTMNAPQYKERWLTRLINKFQRLIKLYE
tara:strand:+ start:214 stop:1149 length:936 start_codon:yes stop_codon:yes gene_type:complete